MGKDVSQVRHEVEAARQDVADAVEALVYKLNAPRRLKERVSTTVRTAREQVAARTAERGAPDAPVTGGSTAAGPMPGTPPGSSGSS